tara:strand:- start:33093 stop:33533 length:441 start_codon:yes stop_codon:yes gene_type:complete
VLAQPEQENVMRDTVTDSDISPAQTLADNLEMVALPVFQEACRYAVSQSLEAQVHFDRVDALVTQLSLTVSRTEDHTASTYRITTQEHNQCVIHEHYYAPDQSTSREETDPSALNDMIMDSRMEAFFSRAFGLLLPYLKERHPPGF